jgi:uroporphyrin-III C-methyltransferase
MSGESANEHSSAQAGTNADDRPGPPADSRAATESSTSSTTRAPRSAARESRAGSAAVTIAAALTALVMLVLIAGLWFQQRQLEHFVHQSDVDAAVAVERLRDTDTRLRETEARLAEQIEMANRALAEQQRQTEQTGARLDVLPERLADLEARIDAMQGGSLDARTRWLRIEAEHYLALANDELQLAGRWDSAIRALELADDRLRQLGNPAYGPVRDRVAEDLLILRGTERADAESLVRSLGSVSARAASLPLRSGVAPARPGTPDLDDVEPGLTRLWRSMQMALRSIVSVERRDTPVERTLSADERALVRRQLEVALEVAKLAVMQEMEAAFQEALRTAMTLLEQEFEPGHAAVDGALATLRELRDARVAAARPDISGSLTMLRRLNSGDR